VTVVLFHWKKGGAESRFGKLPALSNTLCMVYTSDVVPVVLCYWTKARAESWSGGKLAAVSDECCMLYSPDVLPVVQPDRKLGLYAAGRYYLQKPAKQSIYTYQH